ncbi:ribonuclease J [Halanaerocella petrolearia]
MTEEVSIIPLGGREEIGKNMILVEYNNEILVLDCGIMFPTPEMLGVDLVMPKLDYLLENKDRVKGILISHGHEDHIGGIPFLLSEMDLPIYGTKFTLEMIKKKLKERKLLKKTELKQINPRGEKKVGNFKLKFIRVNHSIPGAVAISIETSAGTILYTGDFKFDQTPINGKPTDFYSLAKLGEEGVLAMLSDSTNAERNGYSTSEKVVAENINQLFKQTHGRIIIATFSSHLDRLQEIVNATVRTNRKLAISGRSMHENTELARKLGQLNLPDDLLIDLREMKKLPNNQVVCMMTGSQGETMAALTRIARGEHRNIEIHKGDTVLFSATPIPGNELAVSNSINQLFERGAIVKYGSDLNLHASGHACQEELKLMLNLVKPQYFIPVHGEYRHLYHHALLANQVGISQDNIFIAKNGSRLKLSSNQAYFGSSVEAGKLLIDGSKIQDVGPTVLKERQRLSRNGFITIIANIINNDILEPEIISQGFVYLRETQELIKNIKDLTKKTLQQNQDKKTDKLKQKIKYNIQDFIYQETKRNPQIIPIINKC